MATTDRIVVDPTNAPALEAWDGGDGDYWAERSDTFERSLAAYGPELFAAAAIGDGSHVLDVGCGTGDTTREAARRTPSGEVLGVDLSSRMLEVARDRATREGLTNVAFLQADAQVHPFAEASFDVAISRTSAMFFGDPVAALANIGGALRPGAPVVLLVWQAPERNHWFRDFAAALAVGRPLPAPPPGAPGPFALADPERVRSVLTAAGYRAVTVEGAEHPMWFGTTGEDAFRFVRGLGFTDFLLRDLDAEDRDRALTDLRASIDRHAGDDGVCYRSAAWLVTARRP